MDKPTFRFGFDPVPDSDPIVGRALALLDDARSRLDFTLRRVKDEHLDARPPVGVNTIGAILYHIAITDLGWIFDIYLQQSYPETIKPLFPLPDLDEHGHLSTSMGWTLEDYKERLLSARESIRDVFKAMSKETFQTVVRREEPDRVFETTPEAIIVHLAQHEAEHRGEIQALLDGLETQ